MARKPRKEAQAKPVTYAIFKGRLMPRDEVLAAEQAAAEAGQTNTTDASDKAPQKKVKKPTKAEQKLIDAKAVVVTSTFEGVDLDSETTADLETMLSEAFAEAKIEVTEEEVSTFVEAALEQEEL